MQIAQERVERDEGIDRREPMTGPCAEMNLRQVIGQGGKILCLREFWHEGHATGEIEAARMIAAADLVGLARGLHQDVATMRADVGQATQGASGMASAEQ